MYTIGTSTRKSSVTVEVLPTPRTNMASSIATENAKNDFTFSRWSKSSEYYKTLSATVFLVKLMLEKACHFSGHNFSNNSIPFLINVQWLYGFDANAIWLKIRWQSRFMPQAIQQHNAGRFRFADCMFDTLAPVALINKLLLLFYPNFGQTHIDTHLKMNK